MHSVRGLPSVILLASAAATATADVRLPAILGDHMVLQQQRDVTVWGWADPEERVVVTATWADDARGETAADAEGRWSVTLPTPEAGGPYEVAIEGRNRIVLEDVLIGEVWVCSGQSNMEWPMTAVDDAQAEIATASSYPTIRLFDIRNEFAASPREDCTGQWAVCSPESVAGFSAVAYFFGRELVDELDVPVGLINSSWGGTPSQSWTSEEALRTNGQFNHDLNLLRAHREAGDDPAEQLQARVDAWWEKAGRLDEGSQGEEPAWAQPGFDDSKWRAHELPGIWESQGEEGFDGIGWYRRTFNVGHAGGGRAVLSLGAIDDMDTVWINGVRVAGTEVHGMWAANREYTIDASVLRQGENTIAVRIVDTGGDGGFRSEAERLSLSLSHGNHDHRISLAGEWKFRRGATMERLGAFPTEQWPNAWTPSTLYNAMIAPLTKFAVRGAIWYQGESNRNLAFDYRAHFPLLIRDWRAAWGRSDEEFPFYFVQIAPFTYQGDTGEAAVVRESQLFTQANVPNTGMVVTMDIGNPADIHPRNKQDVGKRLAHWAFFGTYGMTDVTPHGPRYEWLRPENGKVRVSFTHVAGGLATSDGGPVLGIEVGDKDGNFFPGMAEIVSETEMLVWSEWVEQAITVRYAWDDDIVPNLIDGNGMPASPFRTDMYAVPTQPLDPYGRPLIRRRPPEE